MVQEEQIIAHSCAQVILRAHHLARVDCLPFLQDKDSALKYQSQKKPTEYKTTVLKSFWLQKQQK